MVSHVGTARWLRRSWRSGSSSRFRPSLFASMRLNRSLFAPRAPGFTPLCRLAQIHGPRGIRTSSGDLHAQSRCKSARSGRSAAEAWHAWHDMFWECQRQDVNAGRIDRAHALGPTRSRNIEPRSAQRLRPITYRGKKTNQRIRQPPNHAPGVSTLNMPNVRITGVPRSVCARSSR